MDRQEIPSSSLLIASTSSSPTPIRFLQPRWSQHPNLLLVLSCSSSLPSHSKVRQQLLIVLIKRINWQLLHNGSHPLHLKPTLSPMRLSPQLLQPLGLAFQPLNLWWPTSLQTSTKAGEPSSRCHGVNSSPSCCWPLKRHLPREICSITLGSQVKLFYYKFKKYHVLHLLVSTHLFTFVFWD